MYNVLYIYIFTRVLFRPVFQPVCLFHLDIFPAKIIVRLSVIIYTTRVFQNKRLRRLPPETSETNSFCIHYNRYTSCRRVNSTASWIFHTTLALLQSAHHAFKFSQIFSVKFHEHYFGKLGEIFITTIFSWLLFI